jgi:hypothetical protein
VYRVVFRSLPAEEHYLWSNTYCSFNFFCYVCQRSLLKERTSTHFGTSNSKPISLHSSSNLLKGKVTVPDFIGPVFAKQAQNARFQ